MIKQLPADFINRMTGQLGNELPAFLQTYEQEAFRGVRINPIKAEAQLSIQGKMERIPWQECGYYLSNTSKAGSSIYHEAGAFYIQEPSAMLPASVMNAQPGEWILDLCSAPGGKSTQLGIALQGRGILVSNEPVLKRAQILAGNIERIGISNALVTCAYPEQLARKWAGCFDGVQVDAPCSGEGMFRKHPETIDEWSLEMAAGCAQRQKKILSSAALLVRDGGRIVYSTCTMNPQENEQVVEWFLHHFKDFDVEPFSLPEIDGTSGTYMFYPHQHKGEAQFVALFRKKGNSSRADTKSRLFSPVSKTESSIIYDFSNDLPELTAKLGQKVFSLPECPDVDGIRILRAGIHLGQVKGKNFFPEHSWAVSAGAPRDIPRAYVSKQDALRYLHGEVIRGEIKGWHLVCYETFVLGWGKGSDGMIKNHYPKGLRKCLTVNEQ